MVVQTLLDLNRRDKNFTVSKVREVLPEYYTSEYPNLVKFLEYYYDFMENDTSHNFDDVLHTLYQVRDIRATDLTLLNEIFKEIGQGLVSADYFTDPRQVAGLLANFYKIKGSLYSAEGFFRSFYREQPEIVYPKNNLFIVGDSKVGPESLKYIQNGALYQVLSVLVRSGVPISKWRDLYKAFVHPAGFYLGGEVIIESVGNLNLNFMPLALLDSNSGFITLETGAGLINFTTLTSITAIYADGGDADAEKERLDLNAVVRAYSTLTVEQLNTMYNDIEDAIDANSPRFDEDSDGTIKAVKFSNSIETMDQATFDNYFPAIYIDSDALNYVFDNTLLSMDDIRKTMDLDSSVA